MKFHDGGWITVCVTAAVVVVAVVIRRHYVSSSEQLRRLDGLVTAVERDPGAGKNIEAFRVPPGQPQRTAVLLVNGYNGLGLHTFFGIFRMFPRTFSRVVFVHVGVVDAGSFKGAADLEALRQKSNDDIRRYVEICQKCGLEAEGISDIAVDVTPALRDLAHTALERHPGAVVFGGQLAFNNETIWTRWLHNYVVYALQRLFTREGVPFVIVPVRV